MCSSAIVNRLYLCLVHHRKTLSSHEDLSSFLFITVLEINTVYGVGKSVRTIIYSLDVFKWDL